ncbi:MAG: hypothetical protein RR407_06405 [Bacteroidales bacterium]
MKKNIKLLFVITITLAFGIKASAQGMYDAYKFSQQFSEGTARSVAMGNAFVALGGDLGAISINPASSGVYRFSELVVTPSLTISNSNVNYLGNNITDNKTRFGVANFGYVGSFKTGRENNGLINWNIALTFNRVNNYTNRMSASGRTSNSSWLSSLAQRTNGIHATNMDLNEYNNPYDRVPWTSVLAWNTSLLDTLPDSGKDYYGATENITGYDINVGGELDQRYTRESTGNVSEAVINFGGNISNKLFFGINLGIQSIWYKNSETYSETAVNSSNFQSGFEHFSHRYSTHTSGTGINLKFGLIYLPIAGLRVGASISTPTWMYLHDEWEESMSSQLSDGYKQNLTSPLGTYNYRLSTPFRWNIGAAYTFGKIGALSVDYENANYSQMKMKDPDYPNQFNDTNSDIKRAFKSSNILRAGAEIRITPEFALRAGYQYYSSGEKANINGTNMNTNSAIQYGSLGIGYVSQSGFFADIAYQQQLKKIEESFALYDDVTGSAAPIGINKWNNFKLLLSVGIRF